MGTLPEHRVLVSLAEYGYEDTWMSFPLRVISSSFRKSVVVGFLITGAGAVWSFLAPDHMNYVFAPGMWIVYAVSGGVHGYSSSVYLPSISVWYTLGGLLDVCMYSGLAFAVL